LRQVSSFANNMTLSSFQYGTTKPKGMQARVTRLRSKQAGDNAHAPSSSKMTMNTCCWRKCKIIMDDENKILNDLPNLKTALRTRSSASSMLEATLIICGANYNSDNAKIRDVRNQEFQVKKVMYDSSDDDAAFESLHRHSWHKDDEQVIDKFLITNNSTHVIRKTEHSSDAYLEGFQHHCTEVGIKVVDPEQIWSNVAVVKVMQKNSNVLVKMCFIDETMQWNRNYSHSSTISASTRITKRANCTVDLILEPAQGNDEGCSRSICHYWPVTIGDTLIMFECRIQYYPNNYD